MAPAKLIIGLLVGYVQALLVLVAGTFFISLYGCLILENTQLLINWVGFLLRFGLAGLAGLTGVFISQSEND